MILADGREAEVSGFSGMANEAVEEEIKDVSERAFQEVMEEGNEILFLLKRMKERKLQKGKLDGRKKKKLESSKFERELRKLEWTVNYIGGGGEGGIVFSGLDEDLYAFLESPEHSPYPMWDITLHLDFSVYGPTMRRDSASDELGFSEVIEDLELKDLPLLGGPFTWSGGVNNQSFSRLDRFLVNEEWDCHFSGSRQCVLSRLVSDHFPILLEGGGLRRGPSPLDLRICG
ncbi:hypothetical protein AAG906_018968 [Vitis piasezkii]